ncbi:MAG: SHOCT domain-containing protein [Verrucomicrobiota bacterium]
MNSKFLAIGMLGGPEILVILIILFILIVVPVVIILVVVKLSQKGGPQQGPPPLGVNSAESSESRLNELQRLLDSGLISQADFEKKKQEILDQL